MYKRLTALVVALAGAAFLVGGCATLDQTSTAGYNSDGSGCKGVIDQRTGVCIGG